MTLATRADTSPTEGALTLVSTRLGAELERGPHHQVLDTIAEYRDAAGQVITRTNSVTALASGLFYQRDGQWVRSSETIEVLADAAVARHGPHQAIFPLDLAAGEPVDLLTSDGQRFRSHVLGLSYFDARSGKSVWLAELQSCQLELLAPNRVVYRGALAGEVQADVVFEYRQGSFSQEVVVRSRLPDPGAFGLDPDHTRVEVVTEFLEAPEPVKERVIVDAEPDPVVRATLVEPDWTDDRLEFGAYWMGPGRAFALGAEEDRGVPVAKRWDAVEGRNLLVEGARYTALRALADSLPAQASAHPGTNRTARVASTTRVLPPRPMRATAQAPTQRNVDSARERGERVATAATVGQRSATVADVAARTTPAWCSITRS